MIKENVNENREEFKGYSDENIIIPGGNSPVRFINSEHYLNHKHDGRDFTNDQ